MHYPKFKRLRRRGDFLRVARYKSRFFGECIMVEYIKNAFGFCRLGITVSRKYGGAVERNFFKRIVREAFRLLPDVLTASVDLNVRPKTSKTKETAIKLSLAAVQEDFKRLAINTKPASPSS